MILEENSDFDTLPADNKVYQLMSWNIGYCGLDRDMDFFYDGGSMLRPEKEQVYDNFLAIQDYVNTDTISDIFLLQEVDNGSRRSYNTKQYDNFWSLKLLEGYRTYFGINYSVKFVPVPVTNPMGKVLSGLLSISRFVPKSVIRRAYPDNESFPMKYFNLRRCFLVKRYQLDNARELMIINTHNSAFDDGSQRKMEMDHLKNYILREYENGNFVIVGGDWNQVPTGFEPAYHDDFFDSTYSLLVPDDFLPEGWQWVYDNRCPTNRRVNQAYVKGTTGTTVIDHFLVSPNIVVDTVYAKHLDFEHSDHNPIYLRFKLSE